VLAEFKAQELAVQMAENGGGRLDDAVRSQTVFGDESRDETLEQDGQEGG